MLALSHLKQSVHGARALSSAVTKLAGRGGRSSDNDRTVTVFGGTGRIGRLLINSLGQSGTQIVAPHRGNYQYAQHLKMCGDLGVVHLVHLPDLGNTADIENVVKHSDTVVNLTGRDDKKLHWSLEASNVDLTHRIARACKNMGVKRFIHMSHVNASEHSPSEYLRTKYLSEVVVRHELPDAAVIVRSTDCFGREDYLTDIIMNTMKSPIPNDFAQNPKCYVRHWKMGKVKTMVPVFNTDVSKALAKLALMDPEDIQQLYQIVGPTKYTMDEFCRSISEITYAAYIPVEHHPGLTYLMSLVKKPKDLWLRMHTISDTPQEGLPGLAELGITPRTMESVAADWGFSYRPYWQQQDSVDKDVVDNRGIRVF